MLTAGSRAPVQQALLGVAAGSQLAPEANLLVAPLEGEDLVHAHLIVVEGQLRVHGYKPGAGLHASACGAAVRGSGSRYQKEEKRREFSFFAFLRKDKEIMKERGRETPYR